MSADYCLALYILKRILHILWQFRFFFLLVNTLNSYTVSLFIYKKSFLKTLFTVGQWSLENILDQNSLQGIFTFGHLMLLK